MREYPCLSLVDNLTRRNGAKKGEKSAAFTPVRARRVIVIWGIYKCANWTHFTLIPMVLASICIIYLTNEVIFLFSLCICTQDILALYFWLYTVWTKCNKPMDMIWKCKLTFNVIMKIKEEIQGGLLDYLQALTPKYAYLILEKCKKYFIKFF